MSSKPQWTTKTSWTALDIESGEELSDEEIVDEAQPESASEAAKPSKSAIKKAKALARAEKRQQEKAARAAARAAASTPSPASAPVPLPSPAKQPTTKDAPPVLSKPSQAVKPSQVLSDAEVVKGVGKTLLPLGTLNGVAHPPAEAKSNGTAAPFKPPPSTPPPSAAPAAAPPAPARAPAVPSAPAPAKPIPVDAPAYTPAAPEKHDVVPRPRDVESTPPEKPISPQDAERAKKTQSFLTRTLWTFIMIGGFLTLLLMGHVYMIVLVMLCQTVVYREVTSLFSLKRKDASGARGRDPWSKTLNWYFFAVTNYFLYGESIIYYFKHVVFSNAQLTPFATNHRFVSFTLYTIGFVGFVMSLKRGYLKQQFGLFCWVHMTLLLIVVSSHFIVNNILEGLIWFWVPASLVICNDVFAYVWGITIGRTPLIALSPKKTVEGFVGAFFSTMLFSLAWGTYFMRFEYMICPIRDLGVSAFSGALHCTPNPIFVWREWIIPGPAQVFLSTVLPASITSIPYAPYQFHLLVMACFASLVAPFGGFFASGFKRAFDIKDFGHSIPGHGGMTDRMDCQFLMGVFVYVYYSSGIRQNHVTVGSVLQTIASSLTVAEQLELMADLKHYLHSQGVTVNI